LFFSSDFLLHRNRSLLGLLAKIKCVQK
jgi:hypothetical protein